MIPEGFKPFGGGSAETTLHPLALAFLTIAVLLMWLCPRKYVLLPFLFTAILMPPEEQVVLGGLHFIILRILLASVWMRVIVRLLRGQRLLGNAIQMLDKIVIAYSISTVVVYTLLWGEIGALIVKLGFVYNGLGIYFLFRHFLKRRKDVERLVKFSAILCLFLAIMMIMEQKTGQNMRSIFGVPVPAEVRLGRVRSSGPFAHSIIAGTFGAVQIPLFIGLWAAGKSKIYAGLGVVSALIIALTSASSTPIGTILAGVVGLSFWPWRRHLRQVRWAVTLMLVMLHLVMKAPVWALIARIDFTGGSTGYQRFMLVDHFIHRFGDWWLLGTKNNYKWGLDMWDTINWYVASGVSGGLITLVLFVAIIVYAFKIVGRSLRNKHEGRRAKILVWCMGASLFSCAISFLGIVFFDQSIVFWYWLLASIVSTTAAKKRLPADAGDPALCATPCAQMPFEADTPVATI